MKRTILIYAALIVCAASFSVSHAAHSQSSTRPAATKFAAEVPLLECDGLPCVEAHMGAGPTLKMAIDTGNVDSVLNTSFAEAAGLKPTKPLPEGAPSGMFRTEIPSITVGAVTLTSAPALAMNLDGMVAQNQIPHVDGTLSYTAFKDRVLQLDFVARQARISEPLTATDTCSGGCDKISLIKFGNDGPPIVVADGFEINGKKVTAQVDTMYSGSLLIYTTSIEKLRLGDSAKTDKSRDFPFTDGGVKMREAPAEKESFHGISLGSRSPLVYFPTPDVHEPDGLFDGTVGVELLHNAVITLDFHNMTISVKKNSNSQT